MARPGVIGPLCYNLHITTGEKLKGIDKKCEVLFTWVDEVLECARATFNSPEIQLLPKTPSVKRTRQMRKAESDSDDVDTTSKRPRRGRAAKNDSDSPPTTKPTRSTRSTRATRANPITEEPTAKLFDDAKPSSMDEAIVKPSRQSRKTPNKCAKAATDVPMTATAVPSPKPHTPVLTVAAAASPVRPEKPSPKPIPGFTGLTVKAKASAYEEYVSSPCSSKNTTPTAETQSPRQRNALCRVLDSLRKSNSPRRSPVRVSKGTPPQHEVLATPIREMVTTARAEMTPKTCRKPERTVEKENLRPERRSRRSSARVVSKPMGVRTSFSKRKKSLNVQKRPSAIAHHTPARKLKPAPLALVSGPTMNADGQRAEEKKSCREPPRPPGPQPMVIDTSDEEVKAGAKTPRRAAGEKSPAGRAAADGEGGAEGDDEDDTPPEPAAPVPAPRTTRSKLRLNKAAPPKLPVGSSEDEPASEETHSGSSTVSAPAPIRTRSKVRLNKPAPPKLGSVSSEEEPIRTTRSKVRNQLASTTDSPSLKRTKLQDSDSSPPKKKCVDGVGTDTPTGTDSDEVGYKTPSPPCPRNKVIRGHASQQTASFLSQLKRTVNTPSNLSTTISSFMKRNTPIKTTIQDRELQKRREVEAKAKETEQRLNKRQELLHQRAEEQRRRREERQAQAAQRREQNQKRAIESREEIEQQNKERKDIKARMQEEKQREEREKQRLKEKKLAVAELRRKQEEEARLQKIRGAENEAKQHQEAQQRKREQEEAERQRRAADQRRLEEERRAETVRERQREMERFYREAQEKTRLDADRREQREQEIKRERLERERREIEDKKDREMQRMDELDQIREKERARLQAAYAEQVNEKDKEKKAREAIAKHNASVQQNKTQVNTTSTAQPANATLNTTITKSPKSESYEMTPKKKPVKKNNATNYNIENIASDDSTDDDEMPRQQVPAWATGANLKAALISQHYHPPDLDKIFPIVHVPDLNLVFKRKKPRFNKRTSSACWDSPILQH